MALIPGLMLAAALSPDDIAARAGVVLAPLWRICIDTVSIVLEAAPFVLAGSIAATLAQRFVRSPLTAPLVAALAPGCDCAMNGFAVALRSCKPAIAGMALTWGAVCNPIALVATATVLGGHLLVARIIGGGVAAGTLGLLWRLGGDAKDCLHDACAPAAGVAAHLEDGLRLLLPAAFVGSVVIVMAPDVLGTHMSPLFAAIAAALLSPCSTADPVLAKVLAVSGPAQAAFVVAAQCADVRQLALLSRHFGVRRAALAALAGAAGCLTAVMAAR